MAVKGSEKFKELCEAIKKIEYDEPVKAELLNKLTDWPNTHGFRLQKLNKEIIGLLFKTFIIDDNTVHKQVKFYDLKDNLHLTCIRLTKFCPTVSPLRTNLVNNMLRTSLVCTTLNTLYVIIIK